MPRSPPTTSGPEQRARPLHENVDEERQQRQHEQSPDQNDLSREAPDLLLASHGPLLELQRALGHAPVLGEMLALRIANLAQELEDLVAVHRGLSAPPTRP